jgi:outer membrane protein OmpA-like peptidoglycan-associated protein
MKTKYLFLFISLVISLSGFSQSMSIEQADNKLKKLYIKAQEDFRQKKYNKSQKKLKSILDKHPDIIEVNALMAKNLLDNKRPIAAIPYLKYICDNNPSFEPRVCYTLYKIYEQQYDYSNALKYIEIYNNNLSADHKLKPKVLKQRNLTKLRDSLITNPQIFEPIRLDSQINTRHLEYLPAMTADGRTLIFTRRISKQEDFYVATYDSDSLISVKELRDLNSQYDEGAHCISADGNLLIFTACYRPDSQGSCDLYYCIKTDTGWTESKSLGKQINSEAWDAQPSLSSDGSTLYFSSTRNGGYGKKDLWMSKLVNRRWSKPINLGEKINTAGNEASPFIHFDDSSLYFRSDEHLGMGGFDIFYVKRQNGDWGPIKNLGYPINTKNDEGALTVSLDGNYAYYSSDQDLHTEIKHLDLFKFELPEAFKPEPTSYVRVTSKDAVTKSPVFSKVLLVDIVSGDTLVNKNSSKQGEVLIVTKPNTKYALHIESSGYMFHSEHVFFDETSIHEAIEKSIYLNKISPLEEVVVSKQAVILNNIFIELGSSTLLQESTFEIASLYQFLYENPSVSIEIIGHTDDVGAESDNIKLSLDRANSVKNAIIALGIESSRISAVGKGESNPISDNSTEVGRQQNRRTEFIIK